MDARAPVAITRLCPLTIPLHSYATCCALIRLDQKKAFDAGKVSQSKVGDPSFTGSRCAGDARKDFERVSDAIARTLSSGRAVLVHCHASISRQATPQPHPNRLTPPTGRTVHHPMNKHHTMHHPLNEQCTTQRTNITQCNTQPASKDAFASTATVFCAETLTLGDGGAARHKAHPLSIACRP